MEGLKKLQQLKGDGAAAPAPVEHTNPGVRPSEVSVAPASAGQDPPDDASVTELLELQAQAQAALAAMQALQDMHMQALGVEATVDAAA